VTDGLTDNADIANRFASIFKNACVPNSESRHNKLFSEFLSAFNNYHCNTELDVNVAVVNACVSKLKCGKAAGYDGLSAEHVINAHPLLSVLLSLLFRMILQQGIVPTAFGKGIVIPLVTGLTATTTERLH